MKSYRFRFFRFGRSRRNKAVRGTSVLFKRYSSFEGLELRSMLSGSSPQDDSALIGTLNEHDVHESPIDRLSIARFMASNLAASPLAANDTEDGQSSDAPNADPLVDTFKAKVTVVLEDLQGHVIDEIVAGQQFKLKVFVTDIRTDSDLNGVLSAFVEVTYNSSLFNLADPNSLVVADDFRDFLESKDTSTAGKIAAGGFFLPSTGAEEPDPGEVQLLWSATLTATGAGSTNFTTAYRKFSDDAELFMAGDAGPTDPSAFDFQSTEFAVVTQPTISINDVSKSETNANQNYIFTVTLSSANPTTVLVPWTTNNLSATAGQDYVAQSGTLTFSGGATQALITIAVNGDTTPEEDETFNVVLTPPSNITVGDATGLGTILDDDTSRISIADVSKAETDGVTTMVFAVTISKASAQQVLVTYNTQDGTATTANNDYTAKSGTITFAAGSTSQQFITITINGDEVQEEDETFKVVLSNPTAEAVLLDGEATGTITNDDGPELSISPPTVNHPEGNANSQLIFTVTRSNPNNEPVVVVYNTANGTATAGSDYTAKSGTLTFLADGPATQLITIDVLGDTIDELNETFSLVLSNPDNAVIVAGTSVATITDDDIPTISFDGLAEVNENGGPYLVTVKLSGPAAQTVTVAWTTVNGTATAGSDYTAASGTLTFSGNQTAQILTISLTGDTNLEPDETFKISLSGAVNAEIEEPEFTATIANDDGLPTVEVIAPSSQNEGNAGGTPFVFTVKLSATSNEAVTVVYNTVDGIAQAGIDYTATSGTLTFAAGTTETQQLITVMVTGDTLRENTNETFRIDLTSPSGATLKQGGNTATATIVDDDPAPPISISDVSATEGDSGTKQFLFTVTLANASQQTVTVQFATQDGTAKANGDYTAASGTLTFAPNQTSQVITINVVGDLFNEENETFSVVLSNAVGGTIADGTGAGTIQDETGDNINIVPSTISGKVYVDNNGNGAQNGMEKVLAGVQVNLTGTATMQTTTNADGTYTFANLEPGTYTVKFAIPTQYKTGAAQLGSQGGTAVDGGYTFTINAPGGVNGTNNHFATRGLKFEFMSQRQFIASELAGLNNLPSGQVNVSINTVTNPISGANATSTTISGTGTPGALISVVAAAGGTSTAPQTATVAANGTWSITGINVLTLPDGDVTYTVTATGSGTTDTDTIVSKKDTVGPAVEISTVTDPVNAGNVADTAISGTGEVGASISVIVTNGNSSTSAVTTTVGAGGTWSIGGIDVTSLANGTLTYTVTAKDAAGNTTVKTKTTTKDSEAPALNVTTIPTSIGPNNQTAVVIGGTASPGATITLRVSDSAAGQVGPLTTQAAQDGTWSITANLNSLGAGTLTATVVATDGNNNTTSVVKIIQKILSTDVTVDDIEDPANGETAADFELTGTGAPNATIKIVANDENATTPATPEVTVTVDAQGKWTASINLTTLEDGDITFTVTATDTLGNTKTITAETTKDTRPGFTVGAVSGSETNADTQLVFTVSLSQASTETTTVVYATTNGTATLADNDYVSASGTLTFAPGQTTALVTVTVKGDTKAEADETFNLVLANPSTNAQILSGTAIGTITNDDGLSVAAASASETNADTQMVFTVTLSAASTETVTVAYATTNGTATTADNDYVATSGTLTFAPGQTTQLVTVTIKGDTKSEPNETFNLVLSNPSSNTKLVTSTAVGTITNDDGASVADASATETNADKQIVFTVSLSQAATATTTVAYTTTDGTATTADNDYVATSGTLTFAPGQSTALVTVTIKGDTKSEPNETFNLVLSNPSSNVELVDATAIGTITNDDGITVANASTSETDEDTQIVFTVSLSQPATEQTTVVYTTTDGTATADGNDYVATSGTLTFAPGQSTALVTVVINGDDSPETDETFNLVLSNPSSNVQLIGSTAVGTITNDDGLSVAAATVTETSATDTQLVFTVTLSHAAEEAVTVVYNTADGTATVANNDYVATSGTLTFAPGTTTALVTVTIKGDTNVETDETFTLVLSNPSANTKLVSSTAIGTITNDDPPGFSVGAVTAPETNVDSQVVFTVSLSQPSTETTTVVYSTADDTATTADNDYVATTGTLTFAPGTTSALVTVTIKGDTKSEANETFNLVLSNPSSNARLLSGTAAGTITNDDGASVANASVPETNADRQMIFTVSLSGAATEPTTVAYTTSDGTATVADNDYVATSGTLTFAPGETTALVTVTIKGDTESEVDETFNLVLSSPSSNVQLLDDTAIGTITNDDGASVAAAAKSETNADTQLIFTVSLSGPSTEPTTVVYATTDGTATVADNDYVATSGTLTFAPGETTALVTVTIKGDTKSEVDETFNLVLSDPSSNVQLIGSTAVGTITNDDGVSVAAASKSETNADTQLIFTVSLSEPSTEPTTVVYATTDGTATVADNDYVATSGTLTFAPGETTALVTVTVKGDTNPELDETFNLVLSNPSNVQLIGSTAVGTITNDDGVSVAAATAVETNGDTQLIFTVSLSAAAEESTTVHFATTDGTATVADNDYVATSGTLSFAPGVTSALVTVTVKGDTKSELDELFNLVLSDPSANTRIVAGTAAGTITNDDGLSVAAAAGNETNEDAELIFTVSLSEASTEPVTVQYATTDGTATVADEDYVATSGTLSFAPGTTTALVTVTIKGDTTPELDEAFNLVLSNPTNVQLVGSSATGTIINDDEANPLAFADGAFGEDEDWLTFFE